MYLKKRGRNRPGTATLMITVYDLAHAHKRVIAKIFSSKEWIQYAKKLQTLNASINHHY